MNILQVPKTIYIFMIHQKNSQVSQFSYAHSKGFLQPKNTWQDQQGEKAQIESGDICRLPMFSSSCESGPQSVFTVFTAKNAVTCVPCFSPGKPSRDLVPKFSLWTGHIGSFWLATTKILNFQKEDSCSVPQVGKTALPLRKNFISVQWTIYQPSYQMPTEGQPC